MVIQMHGSFSFIDNLSYLHSVYQYINERTHWAPLKTLAFHCPQARERSVLGRTFFVCVCMPPCTRTYKWGIYNGWDDSGFILGPVCLHGTEYLGIHCKNGFQQRIIEEVRWELKDIRWRCRWDAHFSRILFTRGDDWVLIFHLLSLHLPLKGRLHEGHVWIFTLFFPFNFSHF